MGTVSVLLGLAGGSSVCYLACFPHVSASLRVVRPPCRAAPSRKLFLWEYGAYCDRSIRAASGCELNAVRVANSTRLSSFSTLVVSLARCNMQRGTW
ncbi:hypothetical protein JTE90_007348 [Oedothorax gibbosus]|uniref:Secreted protein n=1 Tax=Oedothorax gibbosus TaxID=931172 RepID=A0AAV6TGJ8_9ARAC|nr:hypothetical protein JTE90_007348 [Oedothorax gibbosus]